MNRGVCATLPVWISSSFRGPAKSRLPRATGQEARWPSPSSPSWAARIPTKASWRFRRTASPPPLETYFVQSEQLPTVLRLAAAPRLSGGRKATPLACSRHHAADDPGCGQKPGRRAGKEVHTSDDWTRLSLLLKTVEDLELLDTQLAPEKEYSLWRLFHEDEVRVQPALPITFRCDLRCPPDRIIRNAEILCSGGARRAWPIPMA